MAARKYRRVNSESSSAARHWIPSSELVKIAKRTGELKTISVAFDQFVSETKQYVSVATVQDSNGLVFSRPGIAGQNEKAKDGGPDIDPNLLADGRALSAALKDAGFYPYRHGSVVWIGKPDEAPTVKDEPQPREIAKDSVARYRKLQEIHALAQKKCAKGDPDRLPLTIYIPGAGQDKTRYKSWMTDEFGVDSCKLIASETKLASVANALEQLPDANLDFQSDNDQLEELV